MSYEYERRREGLLTTFIILLLGGSIGQGLLVLVLFDKVPAGSLVLLEAPCLAAFACAVALYQGKRWGMYGYAGMQILAAAALLLLIGTAGLPNALGGVAGAVIAGVLVRPVWQWMD